MRKITAIILLLVLLVSAISCGGAPGETKSVDNGNTKMIAHRGLSGLEVENTDPAFTLAGERSYYGIEADLRRTSDGKFVICHDADLKRIAGEKIMVEETALDDLLAVDLYDKNGKKGNGYSLTTLESYISICKNYEKQAILELKSDFTPQEIGEIIAIIENFGYIDGTTFISFDYDNLLYVREYLPDSSVMYLFSKLDDANASRLVADKIDVAIKAKALTKAALEEFHAAGLKVNCWTVDSKREANKLISWGVDFITSNILE